MFIFSPELHLRDGFCWAALSAWLEVRPLIPGEVFRNPPCSGAASRCCVFLMPTRRAVPEGIRLMCGGGISSVSGWKAEPGAGKGDLGICWGGAKNHHFRSFAEQDYNTASPSPATLNSGLNPTSALGRGWGGRELLELRRSHCPRCDAT